MKSYPVLPGQKGWARKCKFIAHHCARTLLSGLVGVLSRYLYLFFLLLQHPYILLVMVKHNNIVPNVHFHKKWDCHVKLWFDQPKQKKARHLKRLKKLKTRFPRPIGRLQPIVRPASIRHNHRTRLGRGFTLEELKVWDFSLHHITLHFSK